MARHANPFVVKEKKIVWTKEFLAQFNAKNGTSLSYGSLDPFRPGKKIRKPRAILSANEKAERDAAAIRAKIAAATSSAVMQTLANSPTFGNLATKVAQAEFVLSRCDSLLNDGKFNATVERLQARLQALKNAREKASEIRSGLVAGMGGISKVREEIVKDATASVMAGQPYIPDADFVENLISENVDDKAREFLANLSDPFSTLEDDDTQDNNEEDDDGNE